MGRIIQGEIGIPFPCQMLETGQSTQYNSKEDDGYWEKGISMKFVVLTVVQYSGSVNIVLNAKTHALSNNCVFDKRTGLVWARYVPDGDIGPDGDGLLLGIDDVNDEDVFDFKDQANTKELGGYADWRVPNVKELISIVDYGTNTPAQDTTVFPDQTLGVTSLWSATARSLATTSAWVVGIRGGDVAAAVKATGKHYCRLVRVGV